MMLYYTQVSTEVLAEKTFAHKWEVKNWAKILQNEKLIQNTKTEIQCEVENLLSFKFLVGTTVSPSDAGQARHVRFYWKLLNKHFCMDTVNANLLIETLISEGTRSYVFQKEANTVIGKIENIDEDFLPFAYSGEIYYYTNLEGSLEINIYVTLKNLPKMICSSKEKKFKRLFSHELVKSMATLLEESYFGDIKILTKDGEALHAHKAILTVRCPVFSSMFRYEFLESTTGTVKIDDITAKTMKILLHYWYTGELLPGWKDNDTVLEFIYVAEKYQINEILKMLDDMLGCGFDDSYAFVGLLKMVQKLSLKKAEARLFKRIVHNVSGCTRGADLLFILPLAMDQLVEEKLTATQMLTSFDDVLSEQNNNDACVNDMILLALSCKLGLKYVENMFLRRIVRSVTDYNTPDQLFALIGLQNETMHEYLTDKGLLVQAHSV